MCKLEHLFWSFQEPKMRPSCEIVADSPALGARHWVSTGTSSGLPGSSRGPICGASCCETYWERTPGRSSKLPGSRPTRKSWPDCFLVVKMLWNRLSKSSPRNVGKKLRRNVVKVEIDGDCWPSVHFGLDFDLFIFVFVIVIEIEIFCCLVEKWGIGSFTCNCITVAVHIILVEWNYGIWIGKKGLNFVFRDFE